MKLTDNESFKYIQNKMDYKRLQKIENRAVIAETELEKVYLKQITSKKPTESIRMIIDSFRELRGEMTRYRAMYLKEFEGRLDDRKRMEEKINELETQLNIETL